MNQMQIISILSGTNLLLEQSRKKIKNLMPVSPQAVLGLPRRESKMEIHKEKST